MDPQQPTQEERLKSALWYSIGQYVDETLLADDLNATPQFIGALTELVYTQIANTAHDLETFAAHAGRAAIAPEDVMLLSRRNEALEEILQAHLGRMRDAEGNRESGKAKGIGKGKGRGR